jgi:hypothetical protein
VVAAISRVRPRRKRLSRYPRRSSLGAFARAYSPTFQAEAETANGSAETFDLEVAGLRYKVTVGYFPDGSLAECFVSNHKAGNASDIAARDGGTWFRSVFSMAAPPRPSLARSRATPTARRPASSAPCSIRSIEGQHEALYLPSSHRNVFYPAVLARARAAGYEVHDWREPAFRWGAVDPDYQSWTVAPYAEALRHPAARKHFYGYTQAIAECDACALPCPCGTDAHCEALITRTLNKPTIVCFAHGRVRRKLIHCRFEVFVDGVDELFAALERIARAAAIHGGDKR